MDDLILKAAIWQSELWVDTPDAHKWDSKYYKVSNFPSGVLALTFLASLFRVSERAKIQMHAITSRTW